MFLTWGKDEPRQPSGMTPLGFDADRGIHTYQDTDGSFWEGESNGPLRRGECP
jgi:hypothetical protein